MGSNSNINQGNSLVTDSAAHLLAVEHNLFHGAFQLFGTQCTNLRANALSTLVHRITGDIGGAGSIGAGIIGRCIRIGAKDLDLLKVALQNLCRHLGQNRVAARAHIRSTDEQCIRAIIVYLDGSTAHIAVRNGRALHSDSHTHSANLAVGHFAQRELFVPAAHLAHLRQAFIQGAAGIGRAIICRHDVTLAGNIHLTQGNGVHI